ncbi:MAG: TSUP family transporter [Dehalococcoidia bacterium]|nr:TSUP family transporter [Dehalococcoidia bacterium]
MSAPEVVALFAAGYVIGVYATAIGAGGGFLVAPLLLLRYPDAEPALVTTASLTVVALASGAASATVAREGRVDHRLVLALALVAVPAGLFGAVGTSLVPRRAFELGFAALLGLLALYVLWRPTAGVQPPVQPAWRRRLVDRSGTIFSYGIPIRASILPNVAASFMAALGGIGGGTLGIPIMTRVMRVPHAVAVPSMHLLIVIQSVVVVLFHVGLGHAGDPLRDVPWLGAGVVLATPAGHRLRRTLGEGPLMRALAAGLIVVAVRMAWGAL